MTVLDIIDSAQFTDHDRDIGTSGLCGMFALALYRAVISLNPTLILVCCERNGEIMRAKDGGVVWRHAALKVEGQYYDIEGQQQPEWLLSNYVWGDARVVRGVLVEVSAEEFIREMRSTKNACDWRFYTRCRHQLESH